MHEAFYPRAKLGNKPSKIFYGFVQDTNFLNLIIFDVKAIATSVLGLTPENKAKLAYSLLKNHVFDVQADLVKVIFLRSELTSDKFCGERWSIEVNKHYVEEQSIQIIRQREAKLGFWGRLFYRIARIPMYGTVRIKTKDLTIGLTHNISLYREVHIDSKQAEEFLIELNKTNYGHFNDILKKA